MNTSGTRLAGLLPLLLLMTWLPAGCGQKGPLYLPEKQVEKVEKIKKKQESEQEKEHRSGLAPALPAV